MPLAQADIEKIAGAIAKVVPEDLLVHLVGGQNRVPKLDELRKIVDDPEHGRLYALAKAILGEYEKQGSSLDLLAALCRTVIWSPSFVEVVLPYTARPGQNQEALHRRRDHFISSPKLRELVSDFEPRVCCIIGADYLDYAGNIQPFGGTGFLVAPDLILTAAHVFEGPMKHFGPADVPAKCAVFFDYVGDPSIRTWNARRNDTRRVQLAVNWLEEISPSLADDGQWPADHHPDRIGLLRNHLDFALVRLAEPVGLEAVALSGGQRRNWILLPHAPPLLGRDSYVNIPQHPQCEPRVIGFGRFTATCRSNTRFWYDTETDKGSSGAPCLTRDLELAGLHNAEYNPSKLLNQGLNQAIRIELIAGQVRAKVDHAIEIAEIPPRALLWNLAKPGDAYRIVLGREVFSNWLERAAAHAAQRRADRMYAAVAPASGSGKTFSIEILRCFLQGRPEQRLIVFGSDQELLPLQVEDMVRVLAVQLGIPPAKIAEMPAQPRGDLPSAAPDGDKIRRWASETLPRWFAQLLEESRPPRRDARAEAIQDIAKLTAAGQRVPEQRHALANSPAPVWVEDGWRVAWIALDRLIDDKLSPEVRDFIAGLTGAADQEMLVPDVLKRLRWVFLGYRPDFIAQGDITVEMLDPMAIGPNDAASLLRNAWASRALPLSESHLNNFQGLFADIVRVLDSRPGHQDQRLQDFQAVLSSIILRFLPGSNEHGETVAAVP